MFTQEKKDIKQRLNALPQDDRLTWEKFDTFLILIYGGVAIGTTIAGFRGAAIGAAIGILYSGYIFNDK
jgi:hypothetical protein